MVAIIEQTKTPVGVDGLEPTTILEAGFPSSIRDPELIIV